MDPLTLLANTSQFGKVVDADFLADSPLLGNNLKTSHARDFFASLDIIMGVNDVDGLLYFSFWLARLGEDNLDDKYPEPDSMLGLYHFF